MPRRDDSINISFQLTEDEHAALTAFAKANKRDKTTVIRAALAQLVPNFPADEWSKAEKWQGRGGFEFEEKDKD